MAGSVLLNLSGSSQTQPNYWLNPKNGIQYLVNARVPEHAIDSLSALNAIPLNAGKPGGASPQILANVASVERKIGSPIYSPYRTV